VVHWLAPLGYVKFRFAEDDSAFVIPAKEDVRKLTEAAKEELRRGCACFETHPLGAPQHEVVLCGIKKIPHPEEAAKRPSRRTHSADPGNRRFPDTLEGRDLSRQWAPAGAGPRAGRRPDPGAGVTRWAALSSGTDMSRRSEAKPR
jgi:hypothetical protein